MFVRAFALIARETRTLPAKKNAADLISRPRLFPPLFVRALQSGCSLKGLRAADNPARLPLTSTGRLSTALPLCSVTVLASPFPRKSRHRLDGKRLPQSTPQLVSEPDPNYLPSAFCRTELEQ